MTNNGLFAASFIVAIGLIFSNFVKPLDESKLVGRFILTESRSASVEVLDTTNGRLYWCNLEGSSCTAITPSPLSGLIE